MPGHDDHPTTRWAIHFLALFGLVFALRYGQLMIMPVIISLMLASVLWPAVSYLNRYWYLPRAIAGLFVMLSVVVGLGLFLVWTAFKLQEVYLQFPPIQSMFPPPPPAVGAPTAAPDHPEPPPRLDTPYDKLRQRLIDIVDEDTANQLLPPNHQESIIFRYFVPVMTEQVRAVPDHLTTATEQLLFISFLVLFILVEGEMLMRRTIDVFGTTTGAGSEGAIRALQNMARQVRAYLLWRTFINVGLAVSLGFIYKYLLGMSFPWVWAILAGVLTYIPYIGPIVAGIPAILDALISPTGGVVSAVAAAILLIIVFTLEGYVIFPLVVGRNMEMNGTTTLLACLFWWLVWGNVGLFLAMPLTGAIRAICQYVPGWEPWANLMSMETHPPNARGWLFRKLDNLWGSSPGHASRTDSSTLVAGELPGDATRSAAGEASE